MWLSKKKKVNTALSTIIEIILSGQGRRKHLDLLGTSHEGTSIYRKGDVQRMCYKFGDGLETLSNA